MGGSGDKPHTDTKPDKSKRLAKGHPEEIPHKNDLKHRKGTTLSLSLLCLSTRKELFPPNKHFACLTPFHHCRNSFLQSRRARAWSPTTGLVARIQSSHSVLWPGLNLWLGKRCPASSCCRPRPPEIKVTQLRSRSLNWWAQEPGFRPRKSDSRFCVPKLIFLKEGEGFPSGSVVRNPPASAGTWVRSLVGEDPTTKCVCHSSWSTRVLRQEKPPQWARTSQGRAPFTTTRESLQAATKTQHCHK